MTRALFITHFSPTSIGHGGNHRSYQILMDLGMKYGKQNVKVLLLPIYAKQNPSSIRKYFYWAVNFSVKICSRVLGGLYSLITLGNINLIITAIKSIENIGWRIKFQKEIRECKNWIRENSGSKICFIDHYYYDCFIDIFYENNIPVVNCPHNIEAFDEYIVNKWDRKTSLFSLIKFSSEYACLSHSSHRFLISKLERNFYTGLGLRSGYYPYIPVGEIQSRQLEIRSARQKNPFDTDLLLMIGSYEHQTTADSMNWLVENIIQNQIDLISNFRLLLIGAGTQKIKHVFELPIFIDATGWVEQEVLDHYLVQAAGVLIPQKNGFGAVTRVSELSCAGIPVILSHYPTNAFDTPPGVRIAGESWQEWKNMIDDLLKQQEVLSCSLQDYENWAAHQEKMVVELFSNL